MNYLGSLILISILGSIAGCDSGSKKSSSSENVEETLTYTISGAVKVELDSDVDDDVAKNVPLNNTIESAQVISNPVVIGGYLSGESGQYAHGGGSRSYSVDEHDFFQISLIASQEIKLNVFHADNSTLSESGSLAITLAISKIDDPSNILDSFTLDSSGFDTLTVAEDDDYIVHLSAQTDALSASPPLLYSMSVYHPFSQQFYQTLSASPSSEFVTDEVIVQFNDLPVAETASSRDKSTRQAEEDSISIIESELGLKLSKTIRSGTHLFKMLTTKSSSRLRVEKESLRKEDEKELILKLGALQKIEAIQNHANVKYAEPNFIRRASAVEPNDPYYSQQWSLPMLSLPAAWKDSTGSGVLVAVIDTGISPSHEDLANNLSDQGFDFISDSQASGDGDGFDSDPTDLGVTFHGSHVAGIIAAEGNNNRGVVGVAYESTILPLRVLGIDDSGFDSEIATAILYAAGLANGSGQVPNKRADIINLSLGGSNFSITLRNAVRAAISEGVIVIAAAGNESTSDRFYPAAYDDVIGVSSVNEQKQHSSFSNYGDYIDVTAPGGTGFTEPLADGFQDGILSTVATHQYAEYKGTSMAAPHVSGIVALIKQLDSSKTHAQVLSALKSGLLTDELVDTSGENLFGHGIINAAKSVAWAQGEPVPATLVYYPSQFSFLDSNTSAELNIQNPGSGDIFISNLVASDDWIEFRSQDVDSNQLGSYLVRVDSTAIAINTAKTGFISFDHQIESGPIDTITLSIFAARTFTGDDTAGDVTIYLFDGEDSEVFASTEGSLNRGKYYYQFLKVPEGKYYVRASTDLDADGVAFDDGEAVGQYPFSSGALPVDLTENQQIGDFDLSYPQLD